MLDTSSTAIGLPVQEIPRAVIAHEIPDLSKGDATVVVAPGIDRILDANEPACSLLGYTKSEFLRTRISAVHPSDMALLAKLSDLATHWGAAWTDRLTCVTKRGEPLPALVYATPTQDGPPGTLLASVRQRLPVSLSESPRHAVPIGALAVAGERETLGINTVVPDAHQDAIAAAFCALPAAALILDEHDRVLFASDAACYLFGRAADRIIGMSADELLTVDGSSLSHSMASSFPSGSTRRQQHLGTVLRDDGLYIPVSMVRSDFPRGKTEAGYVMTLERLQAECVPSTPRLVKTRRNSPTESRPLVKSGILGSSHAIGLVHRRISAVADLPVPVLITGETGTGKELVARAIHDNGRRAGRPFVRVNCAAIPKDLFESEFFGHARGAYTGSVSDRVGRFEAAHRGTIFLDEIGELPQDQQSKLLTVLQDGCFERVGDTKVRQVDVRIVAATNRDLGQEVAAERFRSDLYYRLNVFPIHVPALRDRRDDIPHLVSHHLDRICHRWGIHEALFIPDEELANLRDREWRGNIRELLHAVERAVIERSEDGTLRFPMTPAEQHMLPLSTGIEIVTEAQWRTLARQNLESALRRAQGAISGESGAAALLGINPNTLRSRLKALGIRLDKVPIRPRLQ